MSKFVDIVKDLGLSNTVNGIVLPKYVNMKDYYFKVYDMNDDWYYIEDIFVKGLNDLVTTNGASKVLLKNICREFIHIEVIDDVEYVYERDNYFGQDNVYCKDNKTGCDFTITFTNKSEIDRLIKFLEIIKGDD